VLAIAVPIVVSNVTTPLVGAVDTAVIGQSGIVADMGGVALGATIFSLLFWSFGFLRMGTSGLTAQAVGRRDNGEIAAGLQRSLLIALAAGVLLILLQRPIAALFLYLLQGSPEVQQAARAYFDVRIWSAPFAFVNYAILGWLVGLGKATHAFLLQLVLNLVNIALALLLALELGYGVPGVGAATLLAEIVAVVLGAWLATSEMTRRGGFAGWGRVLSRAELGRALSVNRDIMIRTFCLLAAFTYFTAQGARLGDVVLAANAILFDLFGIAAYFLDGFAHAAETHVGRAVGAGGRARFAEAIRLSSIWAGVLAGLVGVVTLIGGGVVIDLMTTSPEVREAARNYLAWAALSPVLGVAAFQLDGIYIGATWTADMRNMMVLSLVVFLAVYTVIGPLYGNHGLWTALMVFFAVRGLSLGLRLPGLARRTFAG
jgi:MATE family multidrug resistance protein